MKNDQMDGWTNGEMEGKTDEVADRWLYRGMNE